MKKIVFFFIFIFGFIGAHSQCNISVDITMETHTKQCQACYKKIVYPKMYAKKVGIKTKEEMPTTSFESRGKALIFTFETYSNK